MTLAGLGRWIGGTIRGLRERFTTISFGRLVLAFFLAGAMWFTANYESDLEKNVEIPINYLNLPSSFILSNKPYLPGNVKLRIKGTRSQVSSVLKTNTSINVDLSGKTRGIYTHRISPESVNLPRNVQIVSISPREINLDIDTIVEKFVSVKAEIGDPSLGYQIEGEAEIRPSTVRIKGPGKVIRGIKEVKTVPVSIEKETSAFSVDAELIFPDSRIEFPEIQTVKISVKIVETFIEKTFKGLEVKTRKIPEDRKISIKPETADIKFQGPHSLINKLYGDDIKIYINEKSMEKLSIGSSIKAKLIYDYPHKDKISVVEIVPKTVKLTLESKR
ncbi:CdaR family protein [Candidatus Mycalebacterium sp.]